MRVQRPILTYGGRGLSKPGVVASEHALVYTGKVPPKLLDSDAGIMEIALRIDPVSNEDTLTETSRINLAKVYTIEHNLKVKPVGTIIDRNTLLRGVLQAREQQPQPRKKNPEVGRPSNNGSRGSRARRSSGQDTSTTDPRNISGGTSRGGSQSQSSIRRGAGGTQLGRMGYQTQDSRQEEEESEEDEDDEDESEEESGEEEDSDEEDDPRNKQPQGKSSQQSSQARRNYGSQRTQGQSGYQYSQR